MISGTFYDDIIFHLSGTLIDVELELEDVDRAFRYAVQQYKQKGSDNHDRVLIPLAVQKNQNEYDLSGKNINTINNIIRFKTLSGIFADEPFSQAITNDFFGNLRRNNDSSFLTFDLTMQMVENSEFYTAEEPNFQYLRNQEKLFLLNPPDHQPNDDWMLDAYIHLDDRGYENILWVKDFTLAHCKQVLGRAYRQFGSIPSPTGETQTDGNDLVKEAQQEKEALLEQIDNFTDGDGDALGVFIG